MTTLSPCLISWPRISVSAVRGAAEVVHRRGPAQDLLDRPVELASRSLTQHLVLLGVLHQRPHAPRGGVAGGLVAGDREQQHEHVELDLGEPVAVDLGVDELGHDVVARIGLALLGELVDVHVELGRRGRAVVASPAYSGSSSADHAVRPVEQQLAVVLRHAHDLGDRLQRQLGGEVVDEVARAALDDVVDDEDRPVLEVLLEQPDHARREALVDQQPVAGVLGRVHVEHHQAARIDRRRCSPTRPGRGC